MFSLVVSGCVSGPQRRSSTSKSTWWWAEQDMGWEEWGVEIGARWAGINSRKGIVIDIHRPFLAMIHKYGSVQTCASKITNAGPRIPEGCEALLRGGL